MKRTLIAAVMALSVMSTSMASAETMNITTGSKKGSYYSTGLNLKTMLRGYDIKAKVKTSKGSMQNLQRVAKGEAGIRFTQLDAYASFEKQYPDKAANVDVISSLFQECVFIAVKKDGKISSEDDLQSNVSGQKTGPVIAVGKKGSGSAVTWDYMRDLEPDYKKSQVLFRGGLSTLGKLAAGGNVDAFMFVTKPNPNHKFIKTVQKNENLVFLDIDDNDLNDKLESTGQEVYKFKTVDLDTGFFTSSVTTICTDSAVVVNTEMDEDTADSVADIFMNYANQLTK